MDYPQEKRIHPMNELNEWPMDLKRNLSLYKNFVNIGNSQTTVNK